MWTLRQLARDTERHDIDMTIKIDELRLELVSALQESRKFPVTEYNSSEISTRCIALAEMPNFVSKSKALLRSLHFKYIELRQDNIKDAHSHTFEWIFKGDSIDGSRPNTGFLEWMQSQKSIYWVSGKAGSGKSTLMKYCCSHPETSKALQNWAGSSRLIIASYFFWSAGNTMQKSQQGLLQSLLYQIFKRCPDLIPIVCSSRWTSTDLDNESEPWTLPELFNAFKCIGELETTSYRFCFFVDGLDEYDGEHSDIVHVMDSLARSSSIKLCVSSRPWNVFIEAFDGKPKLRLQDFTPGDIQRYVEDQLGKDTRFLKLMSKDSRYWQLINDIVNKAQGVFLWVFLVVRSLLRGLTDDNDIYVLQDRLNHLPVDLEEYFRRMLDTIEDIYQEQTAQIFQIVVLAVQPLSTIALAFLDKEKKDPDYAVKATALSLLGVRSLPYQVR